MLYHSNNVIASNAIGINTTLLTESDLSKLTGVTDGSVSSNKVLVADENNNLSGLSTVNLTKLSDGVVYLEAGVLNNLKSVHVESGNVNLVVKSTSISDGTPKIQLISDAADEAGDGVEIKTLNGVTSISSDHGVIGDFDKTILKLTGNSDVTQSRVDVSGKLVADEIMLENNKNILLGNNGDLVLKHDGVNASVQNSTGDLNINTSSDLRVNIGSSASDVNIGNNITVNGNAVIEGDLTVNGNVTSVNTTNYSVNDRLIKLGDGNKGSSHDLGIIFTRGDGATSNIGNKLFIWDESEDTFALVNADVDGESTDPSVDFAGSYAPLHVGDLTAAQSTVTNFSCNR